MICPRCGNPKAYFTNDEGCNSCWKPTDKPKHRKPLPRRRKSKLVGAVIAIGHITGTRHRCESIEAACKKYGATEKTILNIIKGRQSGRNIGYRFEWELRG